MTKKKNQTLTGKRNVNTQKERRSKRKKIKLFPLSFTCFLTDRTDSHGQARSSFNFSEVRSCNNKKGFHNKAGLVKSKTVCVWGGCRSYPMNGTEALNSGQPSPKSFIFRFNSQNLWRGCLNQLEALVSELKANCVP